MYAPLPGTSVVTAARYVKLLPTDQPVSAVSPISVPVTVVPPSFNVGNAVPITPQYRNTRRTVAVAGMPASVMVIDGSATPSRRPPKPLPADATLPPGRNVEMIGASTPSHTSPLPLPLLSAWFAFATVGQLSVALGTPSLSMSGSHASPSASPS